MTLSVFDLLQAARLMTASLSALTCDTCSARYGIMLACWQGEPRERPTFPALVEILGDLLQENSLPVRILQNPYVSVDSVIISEHYTLPSLYFNSAGYNIDRMANGVYFSDYVKSFFYFILGNPVQCVSELRG